MAFQLSCFVAPNTVEWSQKSLFSQAVLFPWRVPEGVPDTWCLFPIPRLEILLDFTMGELEKWGPKVRWPRPSLFQVGLMSSQRILGLAEVFSKCSVLFWTSRVFLQPSWSPWEWLGLAELILGSGLAADLELLPDCTKHFIDEAWINPSIKVIVNKILRLKHFMASRLLGTVCIKRNDLIREWETGLGRQEPELSNKMHRVAFIPPSWNLVYKGTIKQHGQHLSRPTQTICAFPDSGHLHRVLLCFALKFWAKSAS